MAKVELKKPVVAEISENIKDAQAVVLVNYCGITVEADTELRKELREAGVTYKVLQEHHDELRVPGYRLLSRWQSIWKDRTLSLFLKTTQQLRQELFPSMRKRLRHVKMIAGVVEGNYYDEKGVAALATVPSREELLGKLLGSIQSPITNLARVLNQIAESKTEAAAE